MKIKCEYEYCIYQKNGECILDKAVMNSIGICESCILPTINDKLLLELKEETLKSLCDNQLK